MAVFLQQDDVDHRWTETVLLAVMERLASSSVAYGRALDVLAGLMDRRLTPLADETRWSEYGLFVAPGA